MHRGWVRLYRKLQDNPLWTSEKFTRGQAWIDLILIANHRPGYIIVRGVRVDIKRGQIAHSEATLAERWRWSKGKVRRFILELEKGGMIEHQKSNVINLIIIRNYDEHQADGNTNDKPNSNTDGLQIVTQTDPNKKDKNENKDKKTESFSEFWNLYPSRNGNKVGKKAALEIFHKIPDKHYPDIIRAVKNYSVSDVAVRGFAKDPERFLKKDFWRDWLEVGKQDSSYPFKTGDIDAKAKFMEEFEREHGKSQ